MACSSMRDRGGLTAARHSGARWAAPLLPGPEGQKSATPHRQSFDQDEGQAAPLLPGAAEESGEILSHGARHPEENGPPQRHDEEWCLDDQRRGAVSGWDAD